MFDKRGYMDTGLLFKIRCIEILALNYYVGWSQWPCGLRHRMSLPAQTLGFWVWILLRAWTFVSDYSVFMLSCAGSGLVMGWSLIQGVLPTVCKIHNFKVLPSGNRPKSLICQ
jgi:hypothetical protein